ncbi:MAG: hypothetical protein KDJ16_14310 [Hyphomicrobiales bacterium]|nr:hypothetical protein [Hyphomicrobiales bacterium]
MRVQDVWLTRAIAFLAAFFCLVAAGEVRAAAISQIKDATYNCVLEVTGTIEKGDADTLLAAFANLPPTNPYGDFEARRICLNSPGGSFTEAIKIAGLVYGKFGTAVRKAERCESACSIVFLAGSQSPEDDRGVIADRIIHPLARLGFHAPSLVVPEGQYDREAVNKAYAIAVGGVGALAGVSGYIKLPVTLIQAMLETPPDQMRYIETVGEASRWHIAVAPTVIPDRLNDLGVINACNNWYQFKTDTITPNGFFDPDKSRISAFERPKIKREEDRLHATLPGFEQEAASDCNLYYEKQTNGFDGPNYEIGFVTIGDEVGTELYPYMLFSRDTALAGLARSDDTVAEKVTFENYSGPWTAGSRGECFVFDGGTMIDHDPCVMVSSKTVDAALRFKNVKSYVWPSGGKTVLVEEGNFINEFPEKSSINGVATDVEYGESTEKEGEIGAIAGPLCAAAKTRLGYRCDFWCWPNKDTGKRFCFLDYALYDTALEKWDPAKSE